MPSVSVFSEGNTSKNTLVPSSDVSGITGERDIAVFRLVVDGTDLDSKGLNNFVRKIKVDEFLNKENTLEVLISDPDYEFADAPMFKAGNEIDVYLGWASTTLEFHGTFVLDSPQVIHPASGGSYIKLLGQNKAILMMRGGQQRRSFEKKKDSEIAEQIAKEHGLTSNAKDTEETIDIILQVNETDWNFLLRRADLYGYVVYVEDDELHFHPFEFVDSGKKLGYRESEEQQVNWDAVSLKTQSFLKALEVHKDQVHWKTLDVYEEKSKEEEDVLYAAAKQANLGNLKYAKDVVGVSPQALWYLVGEGHLQSVDEMKAQVEAFSTSSRWVVEVTGDTIGIEILRAGNVIRLTDLHEYDGPYLIKRIRHSYNAVKDGWGYVTHYNLQRTFSKFINEDVNLTKAPEGTDVTSGLASEGLVGTT